jgi:hypothetical protein
MNFRYLMTATVVALSVTAADSVRASTITVPLTIGTNTTALGLLSAGYSGSASASLTGLNAFSDVYTFSLSGTDLTATSSISATGKYLVGEKLYEETGTNSHGAPIWTELAGGKSLLGASSITVADLSTGNYKLVTDIAGAGKGSLSGALNISSVPLPGALPLFGSVIVGIGALARRRLKKAA